MPSAQHEVNQVNEVKPAAPHDSVLKGALDEMMNEVNNFQGPKVMNNANQAEKALNSDEALDKAQKMIRRNEYGSMDIPPLVFPKNDNSDSCGLGVQKQEMRKQFYDKLGSDIGGELKRSN
ncbi:hypothetical protein BH11CYA1_BH11CYA1_41460 [soil metagenome]